MNQDPIRLRDDPSARADLRKDLSRAANTAPHRYDAVRGLDRLHASIAAGATASLLTSDPLSEPSADPRPFAPKGWIWKVGVAGLATVGALFVLPRMGASPSPVAAVPASAPPSIVVAVPEEPLAEPPAAAGGELKSPPAALPAPPAARTVGRAPAPQAAEAADDRLRQEVANLAQIRASAPSDPARALALADEGNRKFSGGILGEEREASAILALSRLGRTAEAHKRAARFLEEHPKSSFAERVKLSTR
jgi:hypothetical protein